MSDYSSLVAEVKKLVEKKERLERDIASLVVLSQERSEEISTLNKQSVLAAEELENMLEQIRTAKVAYQAWHDEETQKLDARARSIEAREQMMESDKQSVSAVQTARQAELDELSTALGNLENELEASQKDLGERIEAVIRREQAADEREGRLDKLTPIFAKREGELNKKEQEAKDLSEGAKREKETSEELLLTAKEKHRQADESLESVEVREADIEAKEKAVIRERLELKDFESRLNKKAVRLADRERLIKSHEELLKDPV